MLLTFLLLGATQTATAAQTAPVPSVATQVSSGPDTSSQRLGKAFMSPMGEPMFGRRLGEDGLVPWFLATDANHDGLVTGDEMAADAERFFKILDVDQDGEIGPDEITRYETEIAPQVRVRVAMSEIGNRVGRNGRPGADDEAGAGRYGLLQIPEPVITADSDFNRGVSLEEFRRAALARFQLLDTNRSGGLTLSHLQNVRQSATAAANHRPVEVSTDGSPGIAEQRMPGRRE